MTDHTPTPWPKPENNNDVGPNDEGFWEWWEIEGVGKFDTEADALFAWHAVNSHDALDVFAMLCGRTGDSLYDFEEQAAAFQTDTGKLRPGKDVPEAAPSAVSSHEEYQVWVQEKLATARAALKLAEDGK